MSTNPPSTCHKKGKNQLYIYIIYIYRFINLEYYFKIILACFKFKFTKLLDVNMRLQSAILFLFTYLLKNVFLHKIYSKCFYDFG